jgi:ribosomal protein S18 acetylase RimI-like enzyme
VWRAGDVTVVAENTPIRLPPSRIADAADVLARAFANDPFISSVYPNAETRQQAFARTAQRLLQYGMRYGEVYATSAGMEGFAVWLPPSRVTPSLWSMIRGGAFRLPFAIGIRPFLKLLAYLDHSDKMRRRHIHHPHWYLQLLGVDPSHRGEGHGGILLRSMLSRLDREQIPCCLDTENEVNVVLYEHFGFRVLELSRIPRSDSQIWLMARDVGGVNR